MPCVPLKTADGVVGIVCVRGRPRRSRSCRWCSAEATLLCDGPATRGGGTCDAPMCHDHAHHVRLDHDLCPDCVERSRQARLFPAGET